MRPEQEIFADLAALCTSPGYIHAIAIFCFRDNVVVYKDSITPEEMEHLYSLKRLVRTEISTLIGLLVRQPIDYKHPGVEAIQSYMDKTEGLLHELHLRLSSVWFADFDPAAVARPEFKPFARGEALREPIFYGGESAYSFQYRDLARLKYKSDDAWLKVNKGFCIDEAITVAGALGQVQADAQKGRIRKNESLAAG